MKKSILFAIVGAFGLAAQAGDYTPVYSAKGGMTPSAIEECPDLGGEISFGYDTKYIYQGADLGRDAFWADVNYSFDTGFVPVNVGLWYINPTGPSLPGGGTAANDELDIYVSADLGSFGGFDVSIDYIHYIYPEAGGDEGEIGIDISKSLGFVDIGASAGYMLTSAGREGSWIYNAYVAKEFGLTDAFALGLEAGIAYSDGYNFAGADWNHWYVTASTALELNCRSSINPYITYQGNDFLGGADEFYGGVSLTVSF